MENLAEFLLSLLLATTFSLSHQASLPTDTHYTAGVVEFRPAQLDSNIESYLQIIGSDEASPTDIIVFPEMTLSGSTYTYAPDGSAGVIPCDEAVASGVYEDYLIKLSCAAKNASKYIVVNIAEKEDCLDPAEDPRPCSSDGYNIFNTNVVFDRNGEVISRYRKVNLYGEAKNTTFQPEYGYFDTDFGVRFGHFICFDLLFYTPAQAMVEDMGIRDFIFPTMWFSQLPFLTGVQIQSAWSYANDVNFLAAGASSPLSGTTGSGIYAGRQGILEAVMNTGLGERKLYVSRVQKKKLVSVKKRSAEVSKPHLSISSDLIVLKRDYLQLYNSVIVDLSSGSNFTKDLCFDTGFCCHFELSWHALHATDDSKYYTYRVGVLDSWRNEKAAEKNYLMNCALFTCTSEDIMDCGKVYSSSKGVEPQVAFDRISIQTSFPKSKQILIMPNSLKDDLMPLNVSQFELSIVEEGSYLKTTYVLNTTTDNLMAFATYANYFDGVDDDNGGGAVMFKSTIFMLFVVMGGILMDLF